MEKVTNKLTRKQLNTLYKSFDCGTWKTKIAELSISTESDIIEIPDEYVKLLLKEGTKEQLELVTSDEFGIIVPKEDRGIIDKVKTFEDALAIVGCSEPTKDIISYVGDDEEMLGIVAFTKLSIIAKALRNGVILDWTNSNQYKYCPYFRYEKTSDGSGSGWSYDDCCYSLTNSVVGSRLYVDTSEKATYMGKQFISLYNDMFKAS